MSRILSLLSLLALVISLYSCSKRTVEEVDVQMGYEYFPLEAGKYSIFQVDSIIFDTTGSGVQIDTLSSLIRESIVDSFVDNSGQTNYRIERYWRRDATQNWQLTDVWTALRGTERAERVEENFRFIKLVFPLTLGRAWDGNLFIDPATNVSVAGETISLFKGWFYEVESVGEPGSVGALQFPEVAHIIQAESENFIELRRAFEQYAKGVGLIYREMWILDTQRIDENVAWENKAQKGFILKQRLVEHNW